MNHILHATMLFLLYFTQIMSSSFGEKHFIIGVNSPADIKVPNKSYEYEHSAPQVFFSPDHNLEKIFISFIDQEQESIYIAVYFFTNKEIARALERAHKRGVHIEIITDQSCVESKFGKIAMLQKCGISVFVYQAEHTNSLMHNKFAVFSKNKENKKVVWTGSFNFTRSANLHNQENVIILDNPHTAQTFKQQFDILKQRCKQKNSLHALAKEKGIAFAYGTKEFGLRMGKWGKDMVKKASKLWHEHTSSSIT